MMLIAVDGIDGSGKTTLAGQLKVLLSSFNPIIEKEPTENSKWGIALRASAISGRMPRDQELEFFHKDRIFHLETVVRPALKLGRAVILDRYVDSTLAFQCSTPIEAEQQYQKFLPEIDIPDITFILDCPAQLGLERIAKYRNEQSTFEKLDTLSIAQKIYESRRGPTYKHLDATGTVGETMSQALCHMVKRFPNEAPNFFGIDDLNIENGDAKLKLILS
tara:strand:+ start:1133 stop:1792 length:660 start_codon:yes stop_codon:yes gene_type:complete